MNFLWLHWSVFMRAFFYFLPHWWTNVCENIFRYRMRINVYISVSTLDVASCKFDFWRLFSPSFIMDLLHYYVIFVVLSAMGYMLIRRRRSRKIRRRYWMREWLRRRDDPGQTTILHLYSELLTVDILYNFYSLLCKTVKKKMKNTLIKCLKILKYSRNWYSLYLNH